MFLVYERSGRRDTLIPITSAEAARKTVVKLKTKNPVCHREAAPACQLAALPKATHLSRRL